jgi:hypothetical protein
MKKPNPHGWAIILQGGRLSNKRSYFRQMESSSVFQGFLGSESAKKPVKKSTSNNLTGRHVFGQ